jgi:hypothetical protein
MGRLDLGEDGLGLFDLLDRPGLRHMAQAVAQAVEEIADGALTGQVFVAVALALDQGMADSLGREACGGERGWGRGIALGVGLDEVADVVSQPGMVLLCGVSSALGVPIEAGDPGAQLGEAELDGLPSPAEDAFGQTRAAVEVIESDLGLEPPPFGTGQEPGGLAKGLDRVFRERFHGSPRLVKGTGRRTEEIGYGWPESRGRLFLSYRLTQRAIAQSYSPLAEELQDQRVSVRRIRHRQACRQVACHRGETPVPALTTPVTPLQANHGPRILNIREESLKSLKSFFLGPRETIPGRKFQTARNKLFKLFKLSQQTFSNTELYK